MIRLSNLALYLELVLHLRVDRQEKMQYSSDLHYITLIQASSELRFKPLFMGGSLSISH